MCGIAGFVGKGDRDTLEKMTASIAHRGPDDSGIFFQERVGFAHTRLAIIELSSAGHQPMHSSTGNTVVTFNGEIYNFRQLRKEIEASGEYSFRTQTDTEVICAAYEVFGETGFTRLDGMFAFTLHDTRTHATYLVRDRLGKKPLYWCVFDDTLIFGSELKALMCHPAFKKEIDPAVVLQYLTYESVLTPSSMFKHVHKVGGGSFIKFGKDASVQEHTYWDISHAVDNDIPFDAALQKLDALMQTSVEKRMVSDVPLGVFLSGGLDSSAIAYYAQRATQGPLKTFSVGFTDKDFDESAYAQTVARALGVDHTMEMFSPERCIELIPDIFASLDEPVADPAIMPTYLLSQFTRKHVTVALSGNGGDELFAGYPTFQADKLVGTYELIPRVLRSQLIEPLIHALPVSHTYFSLEFKMKRFIAGVNSDARYRHHRWLGAFSDTEAAAVLRPDVRAMQREHPYALLDQYFDMGNTRRDVRNDMLWAYARTYMMDEVLAMVDRASMMHALEIRSPFLDHELVEFVQRLPYEFKLKHMTGKFMLKRLMSGKLPDEIVYRKKKGFGIPIGRWLQKELKPLSDRLLSGQAVKDSGFFDAVEVSRLKAEHESGDCDHKKKLWTLMVFQLWFMQWMK